MNINFGGPFIAMVALGLSACGSGETIADPARSAAESKPPASDEPVAATEAKVVIALDGEGLRLVNSETGRVRLLAFGSDRAVTEAALAVPLGQPGERSSNEECGTGPMDFSDFGDFTANFQDGAFVGWFLRDGDKNSVLSTMSGVGIGTTKGEMAQSLTVEMDEESTIGTEFHAAGLSGLLESEAADAKVTDLWAGANCIFR
mgnify:CR=1 FL=1|tara:strand:+ start:1819 stop:2427 length:609 start_codon:yes stop_codon:yes gene_type:complete